MNVFYALAIFFLFFVLLYGSYARFAWTIQRWVKKPRKSRKTHKMVQPKLKKKELILGCVPFYQACMVWKALYRSYGWTLPVAIVSALLIFIRLINVIFLPINSVVMLVTAYMIWIGILLHIILYGVVTANCARLYNFSTLRIIACFIVPHLACIGLVNNVPHIMIDMRKTETFEENKNDTVIKSKHSK